MAYPKATINMRRKAAPPIRPCNLVMKLRRIRWELSIAKDRSSDARVAGEMAQLVRQTDEAIDRIKSRHQERFDG